jgi:uncharacterized membrane protein
VTYQQLAYAHLATVLPAFLIGTFLVARRKGTPLHKVLGRIYLPLMIATGLTTLFMPAQVGPRFLGHFGFIHAFSLLTLYSAPAAYLAIRRGDIKSHRRYMIGLYLGGLVIAGAFAFSPGRMLHEWLFGPAALSSGPPTAP